MPKVYLHLGSNVGDKKLNIFQAIKAIGNEIGELVSKSKLYSTEAWGNEDQEDFINLALCVKSLLSPDAVLDKIQSIESRLGRVRDDKWAARTIDIDIIFYDVLVVDDKRLTIPHPLMQERNFVLVPLMEIAAECIHPIFNLTVEELYASTKDKKDVYLLDSD